MTSESAPGPPQNIMLMGMGCGILVSTVPVVGAYRFLSALKTYVGS